MTQEVRPIRPHSYVSGTTTTWFPASKTGLDLTTVRQVVGAPVAGSQIIVTGVLFTNSTAAAITMVLQEDTAGTPTDIFPDCDIPLNQSVLFSFPQGIPVTENKDLGVKSSDADTANACIIFGYTDYC